MASISLNTHLLIDERNIDDDEMPDLEEKPIPTPRAPFIVPVATLRSSPVSRRALFIQGADGCGGFQFSEEGDPFLICILISFTPH